MRLELRREETRKAALHALIKEIVVYPDAMIEVKYRIRNRYRTASKAAEANRDLRVCTAVANSAEVRFLVEGFISIMIRS